MSDLLKAQTVEDLTGKVKQQFSVKFGHSPAWTVAAPGRVNLIGDHVDYSEGLVLPCAIDRYTVIAGGPSDRQDTVSIHSAGFDETQTIDLTKPLVPNAGHWSNYVKGVLHGFQQQNLQVPAMDLLVLSSVPTGSGLSSSAALEVAVATMVEVAIGEELEPQDKALLCQQAEHEFAGVPCGVMDQFVSVFGQEGSLLLLDCRDLSTRYVPFPSDDLALLVINSNVQHELASSEYSIRRSQCELAATKLGITSLRDCDAELLQSGKRKLSDVELIRARHVVSENERTLQFTQRLAGGKFEEAGELLYQSHDSLRDDYAVSCDELDQLVELARNIGLNGGVFGSRMTGGGFGGSTVTLVSKNAAEDVAGRILKSFNESLSPVQRSATAFITRPSQGAFQIV